MIERSCYVQEVRRRRALSGTRPEEKILIIVVDPIDGSTQIRGPFDGTDPNLDALMRRLQEESPRCRVEGHVLGAVAKAAAHLWCLDHAWSPKEETGRVRLH